MADKDEATEKNEKTIAEDIVVTKYKMAGEMVNSKRFPSDLSISHYLTKNEAGASLG